MTEDRISKVGIKDGFIVMKLSADTVRHTKSTEVTCKDRPHPHLVEAFSALEEFAREVLEWPSNLYKDAIKITGVTWSMSEGTGIEGAVITGQSALENDDAPLCWNTPHRPFEQYSEGGNATLWDGDAIAAFDHLRKEARAFLEGKREQGDLFNQPDGKAAAAGERDESASRIGELTEAVVKVVDAMIQPHLDQVEAIGKAHGMPSDIVEAVKDDVRKERAVDFVSRGDGVIEATSDKGKHMARVAVARGAAEETAPNVFAMKGRKPSGVEA